MVNKSSIDSKCEDNQSNVDFSQANIANEYQKKWCSGNIGKYVTTVFLLGTLAVTIAGCHLTKKYEPKNWLEDLFIGPGMREKPQSKPQSQLYLKQPENIQSNKYLV